jgi:hypothetical protein
LKITDSEKKVFSTRDDDGIWGTTFGDIETRPAFITIEQIEKVMEGDVVEVETPDNYWTDEKGYLIQKVKKFDGKIKSVMINLDETLLEGVTSVFCPYCGCSRRVEPDGSGQVECEGCGNPFKIISPI